MKVLFVFILPSGGVDTLNRTRVKALAARGIEGHLLYFQPGSGSGNISGIPVYYTKDPETIRGIFQQGDYAALVVVSFYYELELFRVLGFDRPIVFEIQGFGPPEQARQAMIEAAPYLNAYADALLYPHTPHIGAILNELYPHKRKFAFHNPFDAEAFAYRPDETHPRPILAWIGRLEDNKNWRDFLRIAARIAREEPSVELWMIEDPHLAVPGEREQLAALAAELGVADRIRPAHAVPHAAMPGVLSRIGNSGGLLIMTSKSEGAPYAALEALNCLCPVVTSDSGGVRSAIIDGATGLYYAHGDIEGAATAALSLMRDGVLRQRMIQHGLEHVRHTFSMSLYADHFADMLRELGVAPC